MRKQTRVTAVLRAGSLAAALLAGTMTLAACESTASAGPDKSAAASSTQDGSTDGSEQPSSSETPSPSAAPSTAPASTAAVPSASYPADPNQDPIVDLGAPPPAYQAPRPECPPEAKACVDLTNSMTWLQQNGAVIYGPVQQIAGRQGYRTATGMHAVFWKNINHVSSIFGTPMPYATFFTKSGMAFHEGELNIPSHGCVHLAHDAAVVYWDNLKPGDKVFVFGEAQY